MTDSKRNHRAGNVDPAKAFEALRQTVTDLGAAVEARHKHFDVELTNTRKGIETAFEKLAAIQKPVDYTADMARLLKSLEGLRQRTQAIEQTAALKLSPDENDRILTRAGEKHIQSAAESIEAGTRGVKDAAGFIDYYLDPARKRQTQDSELVTMAAWCAVVGFVLAIGGMLGAMMAQ